MKTLNIAGLQILLARIKGAKPLTISAFVDARCRKTGNPFVSVRKLSKVNGMTGANYESSVNRQQVREGATEGTFEAKERQWGERVSSALVEKDGKWYLAIQPKSTAKPLYFAKRVDGQPFVNVAKSVIEAFLPVVKAQTESQGVEKEVVYRNYSLENISAITIDGETYRIRHAVKEAKPLAKVAKPSTHEEQLAQGIKTVVRALVGSDRGTPIDYEGLAQIGSIRDSH